MATPRNEAEINQLIAQLVDRQSDAIRRTSAAAALIRTNDRAAIDALDAALRSDDPPGARAVVAGAVASTPAAPPQLLTTLVDLASRRDASDRALALAALGRYRTRDAVAGVVRVLEPLSGEDPSLVALAMATLRRQTGRQEATPAEWLAWWSDASKLNQREWFESLALSLGDQAVANERRAADLARRLTESYRRLYALLPEADRSSLITELIGSDSTELCLLGFDLAKRALLNARTVDARVGDAAIRRLADPSAAIRAEAASLISTLTQPRAGTALAIALRTETDPAAAAGMLRALAREPVDSAAPDVVRWLEAGDPTASAAAEAALALRQAGHFQDPDLVARASAALRGRPADQLTPAGGALLTLIGDEEAAIALVRTAKPEVADAVALALSELEDGVEPLVDVARSRPRLAPAAINALARFRPSADGFAIAAALRPSGDEASETALMRYARMLPPRDLLKVVELEPDAARRDAYLAHLPALVAEAGRDSREIVADLALIRARAQLDLKDPEAALETMALFPEEEWARKFDPLRVTAMLWLFRLPQAEEVSIRSNVPVARWLDALEYAIDLSYAVDIAVQIRRVFGDSLSAVDAQRLESAERYIDSDFSGPPANVN